MSAKKLWQYCGTVGIWPSIRLLWTCPHERVQAPHTSCRTSWGLGIRRLTENRLAVHRTVTVGLDAGCCCGDGRQDTRTGHADADPGLGGLVRDHRVGRSLGPCGAAQDGPGDGPDVVPGARCPT